MTELLATLDAPWQLVLLGLLLFGFFPRLLLRILVLAFPDGERRAEVLGDLDAIDYIKRPLFVAEQLEVALVEGLGGRARFLWISKWVERWSLNNGVKQNAEAPDTFWIPSRESRRNVQPGDKVKLIFVTRTGWGERMWVRVTKRTRMGYVGNLWNFPVGIPDLWPDKKIRFREYHIIDIISVDDIDDIDEGPHAGDEPS